ncbi:c-type cytochrome [uncultured Jannaschia sp.]|uniref:c-type cytochrome n=1 Tax=uncultured Jannaschia sp. TaxID=293347 RepID=UPI002638243B|nr:c-type cytochrome [uncultured Jannaschia sp.]
MIRAVLLSLVLTAPAVSARAEGDPAYGEYLAGECTTCHLVGATEATGGVPLITGWDEVVFVDVLTAYKTGEREHGPMQMIVARLGDEEMAALAAYFATQE